MSYYKDKETGKWLCDSGHAVLGPSGASRWVYCPGSIYHNRNEKKSTNDAAELGTAVHEIGELTLKNGLDIKEFLGQRVNGFIMGKEEITNAGIYVDICREEMVKASSFGIEFNSQLNDDIQGTADFYSIDHDNKEIHVKDYKNGKGYVCAQGNLQGGIYAIGVIKAAKIPDINDYKIKIQIVQPRINNIDTWDTSIHVLRIYNKLVTMQGTKAISILNGDIEPEVSPSASACRWCGFRFRCPVSIY